MELGNRITPTNLLVGVSLAALLVACESTDTGEDGTGGVSSGNSGGSGAGTTTPNAEANIVLTDASNYTAVTTLTLPVVQTPAADTQICWNNLLQDQLCHDLDPKSLDNMALLRFRNFSKQEVEARFAAGNLKLSEIEKYLEFNLDGQSACASLSSLGFVEENIDMASDYVDAEDLTYVLILTEGVKKGVGARALTVLDPTAGLTDTAPIELPNPCTENVLDFQPTLPAPVPVQAQGPWIADWTAVTRDQGGNAIPFLDIDGALIGFYADKTIADLEAEILNIELIATSLWEVKWADAGIAEGATSIDLSLAKSRADQAAFAGFDRPEAGTWLLALTCSECQNPAPPVLTVLSPAGAPAPTSGSGGAGDSTGTGGAGAGDQATGGAGQ